MFELEHTEQIKRLIEITKSNSGISGPELAKAHIELGRLLSAYLPVEPMDTTVVAMMRGGIFFAQGIYPTSNKVCHCCGFCHQHRLHN